MKKIRETEHGYIVKSKDGYDVKSEYVESCGGLISQQTYLGHAIKRLEEFESSFNR